MTTATIRTKLADYIRIVDEKKLKAIYVMVEDEINEAVPVDYTPSLKSELDRRVAHYLDGGKIVSPVDMNKRLQSIRKKRKQMAYSYLFDPVAAKEYEEAFIWYEKKSYLAADSFIIRVQKAIEAICADPYRYRNTY